MRYEKHTPEVMPAQMLDDYLSKGWFRIQQTIMTLDVLPGKEDLHPLYWLRYVLANVNYGKSQQKIIRKNQQFKLTDMTAVITPEMEMLYARYKSCKNFIPPCTLDDALFSHPRINIYNTRMIQIRDDERLIAIGFYDVGNKSIAGILNCYDPEYKKQSLGKYLLLLQIEQAKQMGKLYYYPGYIAENFPVFDYKLSPAPHATEIFDNISQQWLPYIDNPIFTIS